MIEKSKQHYCTNNILVNLNPFFVILKLFYLISKEYIKINIWIPVGILDDFWCNLFCFHGKLGDNIGNLQELRPEFLRILHGNAGTHRNYLIFQHRKYAISNFAFQAFYIFIHTYLKLIRPDTKRIFWMLRLLFEKIQFIHMNEHLDEAWYIFWINSYHVK